MEYRFYFDEFGTLFCDRDSINSHRTYEGRDALLILEQMDRHSFTQGTIAKNEAIIYSERATCILEDYHTFFKTRMLDAAPFTKRAFCEMINKVKLQEARREKKRLRQLKRRITRGIAGALTLVLLTYASFKIGDLIKPSEDELDEPSIGYTQVDDEHEYVMDDNITYDDSEFTKMPVSYDDYSHNNVLLDGPTPSSQVTIQEDVDTVYLDFENEFHSEKGQYAYNNYYPIVEKYSNKWGLSPNIIMSMLTQESGGYVKDNLMQIQFYSWENQVIYVYNFEENKQEKVVLTNDPQRFKTQYGDDIICITEQDLTNPNTNISVSCIIVRESFRVMNKHIVAGLQCYNLGCGNMWTVFDEMEDKTGRYPDLVDQEDCEFLDYLYVAKGGDKKYIPNVTRYNRDVNESFVFKCIDDEGNIYEEEIAILPQTYT